MQPSDRSEDYRDAAKTAGLRYGADTGPGITRRRRGKGFGYRASDGTPVKDEATLARIKALAIPPAWTEVWIAPKANAHIQATGRDAKGRKQYRYHPGFRSVREEAKYEHMLEFARTLPEIRERIAEHLKERKLSREKVLATVVTLLEHTLIRVGNDDYAAQNKSFGLTTLKDRHVAFEGAETTFRFKGKSGKTWNLKLSDRRITKIIKACQDLPGQELFQYLDEDGVVRDVTSSDVNAYLREISGREITAKDFRTWAGTVLAAIALAAFEAVDGEAGRKKNVRAAIERVAARLGNTPTICRQCYVHPEIVQSYLDDDLLLDVKEEIEEELRDRLKGLTAEEAAVLALLRGRLEGNGAQIKRRATSS